MAFSIERLAPELLLEILVLIPDPASLHNFIVASPFAYRIFNRYALEIFMSVLISPETTTETRSTIEMMAHLRSRLRYFPDRIKSLADLGRICPLNPSSYRGHVRIVPPHDAPMANPRLKQIYLVQGTSLPPKMPISILRSLLADATGIQRLTHLCLADLLYRLSQVQFKRAAGPLPDTLQPSDVSSVATEPYTPRLDTQASWAEAHRISRTGWRLLLLRDLQRAALAGVFSTQGWSKEDKLKVRNADMKILFNLKTPADRLDINTVNPREWLYHEAHTFLDWLGVSMPRNHGPGAIADRWNGGVPHTSRNAALVPTSLPDLPAILVAKGAEQHPGKIRASLSVGSRTDQAAVEMKDTVAYANPGFLDYAELCSLPDSLLKFTTFKPFRRLGLAIWDRQRLEQDLLLHVHGHVSFQAAKPIVAQALRPLFVQWDSILSPEERAEAEGRRADRLELEALKTRDRQPGRAEANRELHLMAELETYRRLE